MTNSHRRLAVIMFTDIVGYTALMADNEEEAISVLEKNRNVQKPLIARYNGRFLKEMGDGILASFDSSADAVICAGEIIKIAGNEGIQLRIGLHQGDVIFQEADVFGDGVNIASSVVALNTSDNDG
jgi:adenylate cyclase